MIIRPPTVATDPPHPPPTVELGAQCTCVGIWDDPEVVTLRGLIEGGMGQWEASVRLWGPATAPTGATETGLGATRRSEVGTNATAVVTRRFARSNWGRP